MGPTPANSLFIQNNCSRFPVPHWQQTKRLEIHFGFGSARVNETHTVKRERESFYLLKLQLMVNGFTFGNELMSVWHKIRRQIDCKNNKDEKERERGKKAQTIESSGEKNVKFHFGTITNLTLSLHFFAVRVFFSLFLSRSDKWVCLLGAIEMMFTLVLRRQIYVDWSAFLLLLVEREITRHRKE